MSRPNDPPLTPPRIRFFKIRSLLRDKLGFQTLHNQEGYIAPEKIGEAQALIANACMGAAEDIAQRLKTLDALWTEMRDMPAGASREVRAREIFTISHDIKDIGALCGYGLIAHFAESLRDYIGQTELNLEAQRKIIQAHVDAMHAVSRHGYKEEGGASAEKLKNMVRLAIEKYR